MGPMDYNCVRLVDHRSELTTKATTVLKVGLGVREI